MSHKPGDWWDQSYSPIEGCTPISEGCNRCWAQSFLRRFRGDTGVHLFPERLDQPLRWRKPRRVFVAPLGDLFHEQVPFEFVDRVFASMVSGSWAGSHRWVLLTKRPERMLAYITETPIGRAGYIEHHARHLEAERGSPVPTGRRLEWPFPHLWVGVSAEDQKRADERTAILRRISAAIHWLSLEPLLGPIRADFTDIEWVVVGGETGPGARPMHPQWVRDIRNQCVAAGVPFWFKSWGEWIPSDQAGMSARLGRTEWVALDGNPVDIPGSALNRQVQLVIRVGHKRAGRLLDGQTWEEKP